MSRPRALRGSTVFDPQKSMQKILDTIYLHRGEKYSSLNREYANLGTASYQDSFKNYRTKKSTVTTIWSSLSPLRLTTYKYVLLTAVSNLNVGQAEERRLR
jgi:hypothetical protein